MMLFFKHLIGVSLFILFNLPAQAQAHVGWRLGAGLANVRTDYPDFPTRPMVSFEAEATVQFHLAGPFSIQSGICFNNKGYLLKNRPVPGLKQYTYPIYLQIPLRLMYTHRSFFSAAGIYWATAIGGKERSNYRAAIQTRKLNFGSQLDDDFMPSDAGINLQIGLSSKKLRYGLDIDWGTANVFPEKKRGYVIDFNTEHHYAVRLFIAQSF